MLLAGHPSSAVPVYLVDSGLFQIYFLTVGFTGFLLTIPTILAAFHFYRRSYAEAFRNVVCKKALFEKELFDIGIFLLGVLLSWFNSYFYTIGWKRNLQRGHGPFDAVTMTLVSIDENDQDLWIGEKLQILR